MSIETLHNDAPKSPDLRPREKKRFHRPLLPIDGVRAQLANVLRNNLITIIVGETGSGKSTQIPQICYEEGLISERLAITQPRRVAAITLAKRVAFEMNSNLGETVAYKVRFENTEGENTKIVYATDGILLREAFYDSLLKSYSVVIIDEAHERSIHTDMLLFITRLCYKQRMDKPYPLRLVIMSATLETDALSEYFFDAPAFMVQGRTYPVELFYANALDKNDDDYVFNSLAAVMQIHQAEPLSSDILVFLTGQEEIETACKKIKEAAELVSGELVAIPLYAGLPPSAQMKAFERLNIPVAFDRLTFFPDRRIDVLKVENISQSSATQRAGRAGREAPGKCFRIYSEKHFQSLPKRTVPEILRSNLSTALLELFRIGLRRIESLSLLSNPSKAAIDAALWQLRLLDTLDTSDKKGRVHLSDLGLKLSSFPVDPSYARVLVAASQNECLEEALTIVSFMSADSVFVATTAERRNSDSSKRKFETAEGDHCALLNVFKGYRLARQEKKLKEWCDANFLHERVLNTVFKIRRQLREICVNLDMVLKSCGTNLLKLRTEAGFQPATAGDGGWKGLTSPPLRQQSSYLLCSQPNSQAVNFTGFSAELCVPDQPVIQVIAYHRTQIGINSKQLFREALCAGLFMNACEYDRMLDGYRLMISPDTTLKIHPSSCLSRSRPAAFVFTDIVRTNQLYARDVTVVDVCWVKAIFDSKKSLLKGMVKTV